MAQLSEEQAKQLAELEALRDAPDEPANGGGGLSRVLNITVDLGDDAQVERAYSLGLFERGELEDEDEDEGEGGGEGEEGPRRRGFFPESK